MANERTEEGERRKDGQPERPASREQRSVVRRDMGSAPIAMPFGNSFTFMRRFMEDVDRLFGSFGAGTSTLPATAPISEEITWVPTVEVFERDGQFVVRAEVPGLTKDDINVEVLGGQLVISGERKREQEEKREGFYRSERVYGAFHRIIPLPERVNPEQAKATFANGVLEITMPQAPAPKGQRVEVQEGSQAQQQGQQTKQQSKKHESHAAYEDRP
jgi:HSP20 family protein